MASSELKVLLAETASVPAQQVAEALADAGHTVTTCHGEGDVGIACAALRGGTCPLEDGSVDVVVLVRPEARGEGMLLEQGALCGARRCVPLVVGGAVDGDPFASWAAAEQDGVDLVGLVEEVAAAPLPEHSLVARAALIDSLRRGAGGFDFCDASVRRSAGTLNVLLRSEPTPSKAVAEMVAARVQQHLRALDPWTPSIDITFAPMCEPLASSK